MTDRRRDLTDDYHINSKYQQPWVLPKVRPQTETPNKLSSNDPSKKSQIPVVPATPRMLRNISGNQTIQSPNVQLNQRDILAKNRAPQRSNSDASHRVFNYADPETETANYQPFSPTAAQSPRGNLLPINTSAKAPDGGIEQSPNDASNKLLPPVNVAQDGVPSPGPSSGPGTVPQRHRSTSKKQQTTQFHRRSIGEWDFVKTIGAGSMGKVKLAKHRKTGEVCAVKIVPRAARIYARTHANDPLPADSNEALSRRKEYEKEIARDQRTIREAGLGKILYHPFICRLFEVITMSNHYYMLFEYVSGGQMLDYIVSHGSLKERNARKFARGIGSALDYLHKNNVVHRDLKIENIMISKTGDIKIIDFGLSNLFSNDSLLKTYCGSLYFAAPELLSAHPYIGPEVDVWSFGVILYVLVCGKVPFDDESVSVLHEKIKKGKVDYPNFLSSDVVSLLATMLVVNPTKRARLSEVLAHPWMVKGYESAPLSFLPHRIPVSLPLDPTVINEMVHLEFSGNPEQLSDDLTKIVSSNTYIEASNEWSSKTSSCLEVNPTAGFHPLISIYYLIQEMLTRKQAKESIVDIPAPMNDSVKPDISREPTNKEGSYEPKEIATPTPPPALKFPEAAHTSPSHTAGTSLPTTGQQINATETDANNDFIAQQHQQNYDESKGLNSILRRFSQRRANSVKRPSEPQPIRHHTTLADHQDLRSRDDQQLVRRVGSLKIVKRTALEDEEKPPLPKTHNRAVSAYSGGQNTISPTETPTKFPTSQRKLHPSARAKSVGHRRDHAQLLSNEFTQVPPLPHDLNDDAFFDDITLDELPPGSTNVDRVTLVNSNPVSSTRPDVDISTLTEAQIIKEAESAPPGSMPAIEYPKTMFLKGLFSVQTTSSKPLPVIRANVISTLSKLNVQFTEVRGGFICVHTPSIEPPTIIVNTETGSNREIDRSAERKLSVKSSRSYSNTSGEIGKPLEKKSTDDRSSLGENQYDQNSNIKSHRRKFSIGGSILGYRRKQSGAAPAMPNTPVASSNLNNALASPNARNFTGHDFDSSTSLESLNAGHGGSDMLISSRLEQNKVHTTSEPHTANAVSAISEGYKPDSGKAGIVSGRSPLKFEIHIVKVPLVGLFGVHFKKVSGNTWLYKTLAGQILSELNL